MKLFTKINAFGQPASAKDAPAIDALKQRKKTEGARALRLRDRVLTDREKRAIFIATAGINLLGLAVPIALLQVYDRILPNAATETLTILLIGVAIALTIDAALRYARARVLGWCGIRLEHSLGLAAAESALLRPHDTPVQVHSDVNNIQDLSALRDGFAAHWLAKIELPFIALFIGAIAVLSPWLALVPIILIGVICVVTMMMQSRLAALENAQSTETRGSLARLFDSLIGVHTIKALGAEDAIARQYEAAQDRGHILGLKLRLVRNALMQLASSLSSLALLGIIAIGAIFVMEASLSIGALAACSLLASRVMQPATRGALGWLQGQLLNKRLDAAEDILTAHTPQNHVHQRNNRYLTAEVVTSKIKGVVQLDNVTFHPAGRKSPLVEKVNLFVPENGSVALEGLTGSGKSAILQMIAGLLPPTTGRVTVDEIDIRDFGRQFLGTSIAYLPTEGFVYRGTIRENLITPGLRVAQQEAKAYGLSQKLGLDEKIASLPSGYNTEVGIGGTDQLAKGWRQISGIIRALALEPQIVLFDEADAGLDPAMRSGLLEMMKALKGRVTMVIASNDRNFTKLADEAFRLENGRMMPLRTAANPREQKKEA